MGCYLIAMHMDNQTNMNLLVHVDKISTTGTKELYNLIKDMLKPISTGMREMYEEKHDIKYVNIS